HLGCCVVGLADIADQARSRCEQDIGPVFLLPEQLYGCASDVEGAPQVYGDYPVPILFGHLVEHAVAQDAGWVHDRMKPTERIPGLLDHALDGLVVGDAVRVEGRLAARRLDLPGDLFSRAGRAFVAACERAAQIVHQHFRALARKQQGRLLADPVAAAGNKNDPAVQNAHGCLLRYRVLLSTALPGMEAWDCHAQHATDFLLARTAESSYLRFLYRLREGPRHLKA